MATALLERKPAKTAAKSTIACPLERVKLRARKSDARKTRLHDYNQEKEAQEKEEVVGLPVVEEHMYCGLVNLTHFHV